jgi:iron(II)-dependent oxidoreductase
MSTYTENARSGSAVWIAGATAVVTTAYGLSWGSDFCLIAGAIGMLGVATVVIRRHRIKRFSLLDLPSPEAAHARPQPVANELGDEHSLVEHMLAHGRYALLLRPQIASELTEEQFVRAVDAFESSMALVPAGRVALGQIDDLLEEGRFDLELLQRRAARVVDVAPAFLDRYPVTNADFQLFVDSGGYDQMTIWEEEVWPAVMDFVDRTGKPGPLYWKNGHFAAEDKRKPVIGINWYEATAYARWVGRRLPSDAEWVKAGCWPVVLKGGAWIQRRYPWGNAFDHAKANLWGSQPGEIVAVDEFPEGMSVGGLCQLIGNTWEWTASSFGAAGDPTIAVTVPMKSVRGGAFDTYFENHATCHFQSGESPLSRKHNIGFRLALSASDLSPRLGQPAADADTITETTVPLSAGVPA